MKREDIISVFDRIKPDTPAKERMLENVLNHTEKRKENAMLPFNFRRAIPALALTVVLAVGVLTYNLKDKIFNSGLTGDARQEISQGDMIGGDSASGREDMVAPLLNQFQVDGRHYILMSDYAEEFGFPAAIDKKDIGPKIATIEKSPDKSLIGCEVFKYLPAGCEAVVAVKRNNEYVLFKFFTFESYLNNQDEDAIEYLKLYGINGPQDIAKVQFIVYTEKSKLEGFTDIRGEITDRNEIASFYNYFSVLKNSSDKYFEKLFGNSGAGYSRDVEIDSVYPDNQDDLDAPVVSPVEPMAPDYAPAPDYGDAPDEAGGASPGYGGVAEDLPLKVWAEDSGAEGGAVAPSQGSASDALAYPVTIRIYNQNGVYYETMYYRNIGFISRYEISAEFAAFIESCIK